MSSARALLGLWLCSACSGDLPAAPSAAPLGPEGGVLWAQVEIEPQGAADSAPAVLRLRVTGGDGYAPDPADLLLFRDELSANYLRRLAEGELPAALAERLVPSVNWLEHDAVLVAPSVVLAAGADYSLVSRRLGLLTPLVTAPDTPAVARRLWPPSDAPAAAALSVFCSAEWTAPPDPALAPLPPTGVGAALAPSAFSPAGETCLELTLAAPEPGTVALPPLQVAGVALAPAPLEHLPAEPAPALECDASRIRFGPGCARVLDDRLMVQNHGLGTLWSAQGGGLALLEVVAPYAEFPVLGLTPETRHTLLVRALDNAGRDAEQRVELTTLPPLPHVVINEVLADALGAEPAQEWVELYNDGSVAVPLAGYRLEDSAGTVELPAFALEPGAYVLLVAETYQAGDTADVPPAPDAALLRLRALGLSNSGETLTLRAADGSVASRFPGAPKPKPGQSVARRVPSAPDHDPAGFGWHAPPGASPGALNRLP